METETKRPYIKPAKDQDYNLHQLIRERYSPRAFNTDPISQKDLRLLLEAARWAPSSMNAQPWRFIYAFKGEEAHRLMVEALSEGNKPWATNAPVLLVSMIKSTLDNGAENHSAGHDLGLAMGNLSLQAEALGIGIHQMGGFSRSQIIDSFGLTGEIVPITISAIGYYGVPDQLSEPFKSREEGVRTRKPLEDIAYHGKF